MNITVPLRYLSPIKPPQPPGREPPPPPPPGEKPLPPSPEIGDLVCSPETGKVGEITDVYPNGDIEVRELSREEIKKAKQSMRLPEAKRFYELLNKLIKEIKV